MQSLERELKSSSYPGRGILLGRSRNGNYAVAAYFIMGRSGNSRNRIFSAAGDGVRAEAFDPARLEDPSLILYTPVRVLGCSTIVTNGDQTDTVYEGLRRGLTFEQSLRTRAFEPDAPHYTPRISGLLTVENGKSSYALSILKTSHGDPSCCHRHLFTYDAPLAGEGHFLHTYQGDGNPLPSFEGEPKRTEIPDGIEELSRLLWQNLDERNKVSLFVRYIHIETQASETRILNQNR
ncbi:MAG: IMP cyclohydrolase [Clostridium sp.]|jgi:hypothetical protein|nr:IMP cyclohydrolase [Clostridium sp.]